MTVWRCVLACCICNLLNCIFHLYIYVQERNFSKFFFFHCSDFIALLSFSSLSFWSESQVSHFLFLVQKTEVKNTVLNDIWAWLFQYISEIIFWVWSKKHNELSRIPMFCIWKGYQSIHIIKGFLFYFIFILDNWNNLFYGKNSNFTACLRVAHYMKLKNKILFPIHHFQYDKSLWFYKSKNHIFQNRNFRT